MRALKSERRLHPRIDRQLPLKVAANGFDFTTSTQNISCLGAYCNIDKYIPPFTRVLIKLTLPVVAQASGRGRVPVECHGVIVRTEDAQSGGFNIAIFFNRITDEQRKKITQYINQFLPQESAQLV
jgi:hypothetical protein